MKGRNLFHTSVRYMAWKNEPKVLVEPAEVNTGRINPDDAHVHDPPYLDELRPKVGYYGLLNVQIKGYDFVVLERYQSYLHKVMKRLQFNVVKAWSTPHQELLMETVGHRKTAIESAYNLKIYERNLQLKDATVIQLPNLIDVINITSPPGVSFNIHKHSPADDNRIYFRDSNLDKLKEDLKSLKEIELIGA